MFINFAHYTKYKNNLTNSDKSSIIKIENTLAFLSQFQTLKIGGRPLGRYHIGWKGG